jgi:hypothetical protein
MTVPRRHHVSANPALAIFITFVAASAATILVFSIASRGADTGAGDSAILVLETTIIAPSPAVQPQFNIPLTCHTDLRKALDKEAVKACILQLRDDFLAAGSDAAAFPNALCPSSAAHKSDRPLDTSDVACRASDGPQLFHLIVNDLPPKSVERLVESFLASQVSCWRIQPHINVLSSSVRPPDCNHLFSVLHG